MIIYNAVLHVNIVSPFHVMFYSPTTTSCTFIIASCRASETDSESAVSLPEGADNFIRQLCTHAPYVSVTDCQTGPLPKGARSDTQGVAYVVWEPLQDKKRVIERNSLLHKLQREVLTCCISGVTQP